MLLGDGGLYVLGSILCFGSFGVPVKSQRVLQAQADPLIYQLYKSLACFGSSLLVLLFKNYAWSWWGTLGASMWVATGTLAIYAIQKAGLGLAQTVYSCLTVFVSFLWGVAAFHEAGHSVGLALLGLSLIAVGLGGLGHALHAAPRATLERVPSAESTNFFFESAGSEGARQGGDGAALQTIQEGEWPPGPLPEPAGELDPKRPTANGGSLPDLALRISSQLHHRSISSGDLGAVGGGSGEDGFGPGAGGGGGGRGEGEDGWAPAGASPASSVTAKDLEGARLLGVSGAPSELRIIARQNWLALRVRLRAAWVSARGRGVLAAILVGLLNGSFLVPYKLVRQHDSAQGIEYVVPFATSALLVTLAVCFVYYGLLRRQPPTLHVGTVAGPALLTGVLWSAGNICSILAVERLGLSVGFPLVQCQLVVSTAWSVLYYKEVPPGLRSVGLFVGSTVVVVAGMLLLAIFGN